MCKSAFKDVFQKSLHILNTGNKVLWLNLERHEVINRLKNVIQISWLIKTLLSQHKLLIHRKLKFIQDSKLLQKVSNSRGDVLNEALIWSGYLGREAYLEVTFSEGVTREERAEGDEFGGMRELICFKNFEIDQFIEGFFF